MKRKLLNGILALSLTAVCTSGLAGCGGQAATNATNTSEKGSAATEQGATEKESAANTHTVTFYDSDGTSIISTSEVADGETVQEADGEKDGYTFVGWFATPNMKYKYDFSTPVTEDLSLYGGFVTDQEDTREFYIVGNGESEVLKESNWGQVVGDAQKLTKASDSNTYTITVDLQEGDQFQFAINSSWEDQRGFGYLDTTSESGTDYFKSDSGLGGTDTSRMNIQVAVSGNYTFTLTTYPGEDTYLTDDPQYSEAGKENFNVNPYDTITWSYNGE